VLIRPRLGRDSPDVLDPGFPKPEPRPQDCLALRAPGIILVKSIEGLKPRESAEEMKAET